MIAFKPVVFGALIAFSLSGQTFAAEAEKLSIDRIKAGSVGNTDRETAISIATGLAECAAVFEGTGRYFLDQGKPEFQKLGSAKGNIFETVAILTWSFHGKDFSIISDIRENQAEFWRTSSSVDWERTKDYMISCNRFEETTSEIFNMIYGYTEDDWK